MDWSSQIIADARLGERSCKSRWPARLDVLQSLSGLALALFMWGHMFFVSSILISKDAMWMITKMFEGYFLFGRAYPWIVSIVVVAYSHCLLATRCWRCASFRSTTASSRLTVVTCRQTAFVRRKMAVQGIT
jgi:hypothetical protein